MFGVDGSELAKGKNVVVDGDIVVDDGEGDAERATVGDAVGDVCPVEGLKTPNGAVSMWNSMSRSHKACRTDACSFCVRDSQFTLPCFQIRNSSRATGPSKRRYLNVGVQTLKSERLDSLCVWVRENLTLHIPEIKRNFIHMIQNWANVLHFLPKKSIFHTKFYY